MRAEARGMAILRAVTAAVIVVALASDARSACPDGDYVVAGEPLLASPGGALTGDVVTIAGGTVAIASGGPAVFARIHRTSRGTLVRAAWVGERSQRVAARLRVIVDSSCTSMRGRFRVRGSRVVRRFVAERVGACEPGDPGCPSTCGTIAGTPCPDGQLCDLPPGACHAADLGGTCVPVGDACIASYDPVCGCDGVTYGNDCERVRARAQKAHDGACASPSEVCGGIAGLPCDAGEVCELPKDECRSADLQGVCVPLPKACPDLRAPVCGCDGTTYGNECERMTAGAQRAHAGPCGPPCDSGCDCEKSLELPEWCGMLMCPACGCQWTCDAGYCDVHVASPPQSACQ
jgi:hypothetical protein